MISLQIARLIANQLLFLEFCDEDILDPDSALKIMDGLAEDIEAIDKPFLQELIEAFVIISAEYHGEARDYVRHIPKHFFLEEAVAADDPARLAELSARRDAEEW